MNQCEADKDTQFDIPVVMIVFRRLDLVKQVFSEVKKLRPAKLYIISDGPRNEKEKEEVLKVREYIELGIDWHCELHKNYAEKNIGLRFRMPTGVDWVFENEDQAIFLEDDICPDQSFFWFCREMLQKYKDDPKIMMVSGMNVYPEDASFGQYDITFSRIPLTWGWATWKRAWSLYDVNIKSWRNKSSKAKLKKILSPNAYRFFVNIFDDLQYHWINDAWDYQWEYAMFMNDGIGIIPRFNMIKNLGMNTEGAEHKGDSDKKEKMISLLPVKAMPSKLNIPGCPMLNNEYDIRFQKDFYEQTGIIKYLKLVYRARLNDKAYGVIKEMEADSVYFDNEIDDSHRLNAKEQDLYGGDKYRQTSGRAMREAAKKYKNRKK